MDTIAYYHQHADYFNDTYSSLSAETVHQVWLAEYLPNQGNLLDVGAGNGRDALYFASKGLQVVAVEPANNLRAFGEKQSAKTSIKWVNDKLPLLTKVQQLNICFDIILLSAVWMHILSTDRKKALSNLKALLKSSGKIIITLRHGASPDERVMHPVSTDELLQLSKDVGLSCHVLPNQKDKLGRQAVRWQTVVLERLKV